MTETALTPSQQHTGALDVYGAGQDIRQMAERIKLCLPGGERLQVAETMALAQLAVAYALNPFNGEVWYIPGKGPMVGIKGHRKAARRQGQYWLEHILLTPQERADLAIPDGAIAYKCLVYRTDMIRQSAESIKLMYDAGMKDAAERYAYKPTMGIGYCLKNESTKMKPDQAARKRAEADALKIAFDLPFATDIGNGNRVGYVDDMEALDAGAVNGEFRVVDQELGEAVDGETGEIIDVTPVRSAAPTNGDRKPPAKQKASRPAAAPLVRNGIRHNGGWMDKDTRVTDGEPITEAQSKAIHAVMRDAVKPSAGVLSANEVTERRHAILEYLLGVNSTEKLTKLEASAILDWLTVPNGTNLNEYASREAASVYAAWQEEHGQQTLPLGESVPF